MSNAKQNVYTNSSFRSDMIDSEYEEVVVDHQSLVYDDPLAVEKSNPSNVVRSTLPNIPQRKVVTNSHQKIQISLLLLFLIIICSLIAIILTGVVTFVITKNTLQEKQGDEDLLDMRFSRRWLYKNVFISADNTIISNVQTIDTSSSAEAQLQNYRGTISDLCVGNNELIYYEVYYTYTIVKALTTTSLVLEVGLADRLKVDRYYYVGSNNVSGWSFHVARNADDNSIYVYTEDPVHLKLLGPFSTNTVGKKVHGKFKLSINRRRNEFSLRQNDSIFHVFKNVTSGGKLCPVFGVYNSNQVHVKLQLMNPRNFTNFPW